MEDYRNYALHMSSSMSIKTTASGPRVYTKEELISSLGKVIENRKGKITTYWSEKPQSIDDINNWTVPQAFSPIETTSSDTFKDQMLPVVFGIFSDCSKPPYTSYEQDPFMGHMIQQSLLVGDGSRPTGHMQLMISMPEIQCGHYIMKDKWVRKGGDSASNKTCTMVGLGISLYIKEVSDITYDNDGKMYPIYPYHLKHGEDEVTDDDDNEILHEQVHHDEALKISEDGTSNVARQKKRKVNNANTFLTMLGLSKMSYKDKRKERRSGGKSADASEADSSGDEVGRYKAD